MKRAFIDQIMLGLFLFVSLVVLGATVNDEMDARNTYYKLKKLTDNAALSMAKYYNSVNPNTLEAEAIANAMLDKTKLGQQIKGSITYTWDLLSYPKTVTAKVPSYTYETFWFRFLDMASFTLKAESTAKIVDKTKLDIKDKVNDYVPFAVNECGQTSFNPGDSYSFIYKPYAIYDANEAWGFYGLADTEPDRLDGSQDGFAHFKNEVTTFDRTQTQQYLVDSDLSTIENDAQQLASELEVHKFNDNGIPWDISIALLDCSSTKDNIIIKNLIPVSMTKIYCGDKDTPQPNIDSAFVDDTGNVMNDVTWVEWVESKDCSQSGLFRMDITVQTPEEVILDN